MVDYLRQLGRVILEHPARAAIVDQDGERTTDYQTLAALSDRVAAYLRRQGLRPGDVVALMLPKGLEHIAARIAVMKIGAAWVSLSEDMGAERVRFALRECACALEFDMGRWEEAMGCPPLPEAEWADPGPHDLAFIIYTSGSSGTPKGAMQEYGVYDDISAAFHQSLDRYAPIQFAHLIPEYFVGGVYITVAILQNGSTIHVLSPDLVRNPGALFGYLIRFGISGIFVPPALAKLLRPREGLGLRFALIGGEIVSQIQPEGYDAINIYGPSEFGYPICQHRFESAMDNTPIGIPLEGKNTALITEEGEETQQEGIFCAELPYFRGYVSQTAASFVQLRGRRYYVSGDLASRDREGRITILGRGDGMVNINGNRVYPSEVAEAVKAVLGTEQAAVRAFDVKGKPYLCAFYAEVPKADGAELSRRLRERLPAYMIPSAFVRLDRLPRNPAGKVELKELRLPETEVLFAPYAPPETAVEQQLCRAMARLLDTRERGVGLDDDFFALGGDSLTAMQLLLETELPGLDISLLFRARTPREIAKELSRLHGGEDHRRVDLPSPCPLLPFQAFYLGWNGSGTALIEKSIALELVFRPGTDSGRIARAVECAVRAHRALSTVISEEGGRFVQRLCPEKQAPVTPERVAPDSLVTEEAVFLRPFVLDGTPLFRTRLFETDRGCVLWLNVHHCICDGESIVLLIRDILSACRDGKVEGDDYPRFLACQLEELTQERRQRSWDKLLDRLSPYRWVTLPASDQPASDEFSAAGQFAGTLRGDRASADAFVRLCGISETDFYTAAALLVLGIYENAEHVLTEWIWNGRATHASMRRVGLLIHSPQLCGHLHDGLTMKAFLDDVSRQRMSGMSESENVFLGDLSDPPAQAAAKTLPSAALCFNYQTLEQNMDDPLLASYRRMGDFVRGAEEPLEFLLWDNGERLRLEIQYDCTLYTEERIQRLFSLYDFITDYLGRSGDPGMTFGQLRAACVNH